MYALYVRITRELKRNCVANPERQQNGIWIRDSRKKKFMYKYKLKIKLLENIRKNITVDEIN